MQAEKDTALARRLLQEGKYETYEILFGEVPPEVKDEDFNTVIGDYEEALNNALVETVQGQIESKKVRTYTQSEIPVRPCTAACLKRSNCKDFIIGRVQDRDLCKPELRQIKKWQVAFRRGDTEALKDDIGAVAGSLMTMVERLIEKVIEEGVVIDQEKVSASGDSYTEEIEHPALKRIESICKSLGIDLSSFLMTPKSLKDSPPQVQVNIGISAEEVQNRFSARFSDSG